MPGYRAWSRDTVCHRRARHARRHSTGGGDRLRSIAPARRGRVLMQYKTFRIIVFALAFVACRKQTEPVAVPTGASGSGSGFTASCNGDFPSWISATPPIPDASGDVNPNEPGVQKAFELAQSYPLGTPVFVNTNGHSTIDHYDPPQPNVDAPWRSFSNLSNAAQRTGYLDALKTYILATMSNPTIEI